MKIKNPLPKPDLTGRGVAAWSRIHILQAISTTFTTDEREQHRADASRCHCGRCRRYARCKFLQPRCVADVAHNVCRTGSKAAGRVAGVATTVDHFADDCIVSFGIGAGTCAAGWTQARGAAIEFLFGVEVEPIATRVALAAFPHARIVPDVDLLEIPRTGRLVVITSLVLNVIGGETARSWAKFCTLQREKFLHVNVGRIDEPGALRAFEEALLQDGFVPTAIALPSSIDFYDVGYITTANWWQR